MSSRKAFVNVARSIVAFPLLASFLSCPVAPVVHPSEGSPFLRCPTRVFLPRRLLRGRGRLGGQVRGEDCHQSRARVSGVLRRVRQGSLRIDRSSAPVDREGSHCQESFRGLWALHREYGWGPCGWGGEEGTHEIPVSSSSSVKDDIPVELSFFYPNKS